MLNFGHTLGHAIENTHQLLHGHAISIGMIAACTISEHINGFSAEEKQQVISLFEKYQLPTKLQFDQTKIWQILKMDKKRAGNEMNFILLNKIGEAVIKSIPLDQLKELINKSL